MGLKSRKHIEVNSQPEQNALSRWLDEHADRIPKWLDPGTPGLEISPRERFASLLGVDRKYLDLLCHGTRKPGRTLMGMIISLTAGEITCADFGFDDEVDP